VNTIIGHEMQAPGSPPGAEAEESTPKLVQQAVDRAGHLIAAEIRLAKQELGESMRAGITALIAAAVAVFGTIAFFVMAVVTVTIAVNLHWAASLGFALLFLAIAIAGGLIAVQRLRRIRPLRQTAETVQEDVAWAKQQLTRAKR
jgi:uncharacterized membrane protein YqjE